MNEVSVITAVFGVYLLVLFALAVWCRKSAENIEGYFIAGKKLPYWVVAFSANATGESGWLLLGVTGMAYLVGIHALWVMVGEVIGVSLSWFLIAKRLKAESDAVDAITIPDYLDSRFHDSRQLVRLCCVAIIVIMVFTYVTAQMVATGKAFGDFMQIDYRLGVLLGALVILFYTVIGGYKAVAYTDLVQGVLMLLALIIVPLVAINDLGGLGGLFAALEYEDPGLVRMMGPDGWSFVGIIAVASFLAIGLPFMGAPQFLVRYMSITEQEQIPKAAGMSIACILLFGLGAVFVGLAGRVMAPDLPDPELIFPTLSRELFPPLITGVLLVVLLAAIMSTADSLLILLSSAVTRDLLQKVIKPDLSSAALVGVGRASTFLVGLLALLFALVDDRTLFWFILFSWSGLGAAFGPVVICTLIWREKVTLAGGLSGILGGFLITLIWGIFLKPHFFNMYEAIPGFLGSFLLIYIVSKRTAAPSGMASGTPSGAG